MEKVSLCSHICPDTWSPRRFLFTREAYDRLKARKGPEESFSDVILRLTERRPLAESAGMLSKTSVKAIRKAIDEARRHRRALDARA